MTDEEIQQFVTRTVQGAIQASITPLGDQMRTLVTSVEGLRTAPPAAPAAPAPAAPAAPAPAAPAAPAAPQAGLSPEANAIILEMKRNAEQQAAQIKALNEKNTAAEQKADVAERASVIDRALGGFAFASDQARSTAIALIQGSIKRTDAGQLVAGDNLTPEAFIKDFLPSQHPYLLAPTNTSGSGVTPGSPRGAASQAVDLDSIKPGMSAEQRAAAVQAIVQAGATLNGGR